MLDGGQAKFCIQNDAQVKNAENCDNGATTSSSCSSMTGTSASVIQAKDSVVILRRCIIMSGSTNPCSTCTLRSKTHCTSCVREFPHKAGTTFATTTSSVNFPYEAVKQSFLFQKSSITHVLIIKLIIKDEMTL